MNKRICILAALLAVFPLADAQADKADSLDQADSACMDKANTTVDMVECGAASYKRWDGELNRAYLELRRYQDAAGQAALKESQTKWLAYRDAELKTIRAIYSAQGGTINAPLGGDAATQLVRHRAQELRAYVDSLKPQGP